MVFEAHGVRDMLSVIGGFWSQAGGFAAAEAEVARPSDRPASIRVSGYGHCGYRVR
jgi:hypothetical protein